MGTDTVTKWLPALALFAGVVSTSTIMQFQIAANAQSGQKNEEEVDANKAAIVELQKVIIENRGNVRVELQEMRGEQRALNQKMDIIIDMLKPPREQDRQR
jgi:hypothetical protein